MSLNDIVRKHRSFDRKTTHLHDFDERDITIKRARSLLYEVQVKVREERDTTRLGYLTACQYKR